MRSQFAVSVTISVVLGLAGVATAQNTNTNSNTKTNSARGNTNSNTDANSNRGNANRSNSSRGNTNNNSNMEMSSTTGSNSSRATAAAGGSVTAMDNKFAMDAAYGNNAEIAAGRQALQKSSNPDVQRFAQMMIDHHTQANADLASMAPGMTLPTGLHPHHQAVADGHAKLSGMDFDMAFIKGQIADHTATLDMLDMYDDDGKNKELKGYAKKAEPIVKQHLSMVKAMDMRMATGMPMPNARTNK